MASYRIHLACLALSLLGCREPARLPARVRTPPTDADIRQAALTAVQAAPWDTDATGWGALCSPRSPCDTIVVEPRIVSLPAQAPAFFVPDRREVAALLSADAIAQARAPGRVLAAGDYRTCSARRDAANWTKGRVACVALGVAGLDQAWPDAMTFALLTVTPAKGLSWPRMRVTRPRHAWEAVVVSNAGE